ncbi:hypothetical protein BZG36_00713 [Bifiguratus adelaidae]|uniref:Mak10 subunit, NatC N(Alpha)-terminal acetyltransferase n=1 Tax=Bifiguratus adelaidae TaxID=1938954 RepID=A0A261Y6X0_9FUNG|nr:hypothetical protein BZG36_00713 [Bifiguratus adelaidae]
MSEGQGLWHDIGVRDTSQPRTWVEQELSGVGELSLDNSRALHDDDELKRATAPEYTDMTQLLMDATSDFASGQLLHLDSFTLFDAMSALEMMDPKMDTGMVLDSDKNKVPYNVHQPLDASQVLYIMDELFCCESTWLTGQSLSQTIYTCNYFHHVKELDAKKIDSSDPRKPPELVSVVLKGYIVATIKCCHVIWKEMNRGNVYEEEDFTTNLFGLDLLEHYTNAEAVNDIDMAIAFVEKRLLDEIGDEAELWKAISQRLALRKHLTLALIHLSRPNCERYFEAHKELLCMEPIVMSKDLASTMKLGIEVNNAFDPSINRKFAAHTPPRPITLLTREESLSHLQYMRLGLQRICEVVHFDRPQSLLNFLYFFAAYRPPPCGFTRSKMITTFYCDLRIMGSKPVKHFMRDTILDFCGPPAWWFGIDEPPRFRKVPDAGHKIKAALDVVNGLMENASRIFIDFCKTQCHNRSRQRRLHLKLLADWEVLQEEAENADVQLQEIESALKNEAAVVTDPTQPFYLSSWVYHRKLIVIEYLLTLGFDNEMYGLHEYAMMLCSQALAWSYPSRLFQGKTSKVDGQRPPTMSSLVSIQILNLAKQDLTRGLYRAILAFQKSGHLNIPALQLDDEATRFSHRFERIRQLASPSPLSYSDYVDAADIDGIEATQESMQSARSALESLLSMTVSETQQEYSYDEWKEDLQSLLKTCIANSVALQIMLKNGISATKKVLVQNKYHAIFPSFTIT